ncbi:MAG: hypothetical protein EA409_13505 [Saprospirales bacterium]|nr:MAG: hypothetical protein EA409_13505 [Saprospirales bacterium]
MKIKELSPRPEVENNDKLKKAVGQFENLLDELRHRDLPDELVLSINTDIEKLSASPMSGDDLVKTIKKVKAKIVKSVEKGAKLVPINYYRNLWFPLGMAVYGLPLGVVFGMSLGNMAFLGIGLPIGMALGIAVGSQMDKKAYKEGRQLGIEIKHLS